MTYKLCTIYIFLNVISILWWRYGQRIWPWFPWPWYIPVKTHFLGWVQMADTFLLFFDELDKVLFQFLWKNFCFSKYCNWRSKPYIEELNLLNLPNGYKHEKTYTILTFRFCDLVCMASCSSKMCFRAR